MNNILVYLLLNSVKTYLLGITRRIRRRKVKESNAKVLFCQTPWTQLTQHQLKHLYQIDENLEIVIYVDPFSRRVF